jgi:hypothetical protein
MWWTGGFKVRFLGFRFGTNSDPNVEVLISAKTKVKLNTKILELTPRRWESSLRLSSRQAKNKRARTAPIYAEMVHWLELQKKSATISFPIAFWVFIT